MFEAFPSVVKAELERIGQNQQWLAEQLGISHVSVSNWLTGKRRPAAESVEAVARAFGRNASWLFEQMEQAAVSTDPDASRDGTPAWNAAWGEASASSGAAIKVRPHPFTGEDTRDTDMNHVLAGDAACPTCGHKTEAA